MLRRITLIPALALLIILGLTACSTSGQPGAIMQIVREPVAEGDVEQGRLLLASYGCGACHTIPGVEQANTYVGPPLTNWSQRSYIAGNLPNTLDNLIAWIMNPQEIEPGTAMPVLGVSEEEARHMSAYLYTLGN